MLDGGGAGYLTPFPAAIRTGTWICIAVIRARIRMQDTGQGIPQDRTEMQNNCNWQTCWNGSFS